MALTAAQLAALSNGTMVGKLAVEIDASTPLRYCNGQAPVQISGDWYEPRWIQGSYFDLIRPDKARATIAIDDRDGVLETANYTDRFSGYTCTLHMLLREVTSPDWTEINSLVWTVENSDFNRGNCNLNLFAGAGYDKKFTLFTGTESMFPHAPKPGDTIQFRSITIAVEEASDPHTVDRGTDIVEPIGTKPKYIPPLTPKNPKGPEK